MKVDFNNLRTQALIAHDKLIDLLNAAIVKNQDHYATPNGFRQNVCLEGFVLIEADEIETTLNDLRMTLGTIAMCYEEGDPDMADVYSAHYPESEGKSMATFRDDYQ